MAVPLGGQQGLTLCEEFMHSLTFRRPVFGLACQTIVAGLALGASLAYAQPMTSAQTSSQVPAPEPSGAAALALPYRSAFTGYQGYSDQKIAPWTETNSTVEKIGGWRVYAKEAREPDNTDMPTAPAPAGGAHGRHGGKP